MRGALEQLRATVAAEAAQWFVTHRAGVLTEAQRHAFVDWLRASPVHAGEYIALAGFTEDLGQASRRIATPQEVLIAQARDDATGAVHLRPPSMRPSGARGAQMSPTRSPFGLLATAVLVAVVTWWAWPQPHYATTHAEQRSWRLPDGSTVHLNSDSRVELDFDGAQRRVSLVRGQAIFQVAPDPGRPFTVRAGEAIVTAVGTQFDVYRRPGRTTVSVLEGRVAVSKDAAALALELAAGEQVTLTPGNTVVSGGEMAVRSATAWLQRQIVFERAPLAEVVEEFNRYNEMRIQVGDPALRREPVSGIFNAYDTESFMQFLKRQPGVRLERRGDTMWVGPAQEAR